MVLRLPFKTAPAGLRNSVQNVVKAAQEFQVARTYLILPFVSVVVLWTFLSGMASSALGAAWLASHWMYLTLVFGVLLLIPLALTSSESSNPDWLLATTLMLYTIHQFEAYGLSVYGERYGFIKHLGSLLSCTDMKVERDGSGYFTITGCPGLSPEVILRSNVYGVLLLFGGSLLLVPKIYRPYQACLCISMVLYQALILDGAALFLDLNSAGVGYHAGLVSSGLLTIPFGAFALKSMCGAEWITPKDLLVAFVLVGIPGQLVLVWGPISAGKIPYGLYVSHILQLLLTLCLLFSYKVVAKVGLHTPTDRAKKIGEAAPLLAGTPLSPRTRVSVEEEQGRREPAEPIWTVESGWAGLNPQTGSPAVAAPSASGPTGRTSPIRSPMRAPGMPSGRSNV